MFYVYVLISTRDGELYIGSTNDLKKRFREHNSGKVPSTKTRTPFHLLYYEAYSAEVDARKREARLKQRGQARVHLLKRLSGSIALFQNET
ncbi:MAG: GIY-YIG nuclease family protein [Candidatus Pacebacteria bacterium]|nr:GIY-YIG nuclease family protein [Candidatus Paceibacterota bacterium]